MHGHLVSRPHLRSHLAWASLLALCLPPLFIILNLHASLPPPLRKRRRRNSLPRTSDGGFTFPVGVRSSGSVSGTRLEKTKNPHSDAYFGSVAALLSVCGDGCISGHDPLVNLLATWCPSPPRLLRHTGKSRRVGVRPDLSRGRHPGDGSARCFSSFLSRVLRRGAEELVT